ncbi:MAG TPA: tRNA (guanosine(46)-N7)-methyltransferase TrmB [Caulobacterales bacterium]|nr:tRNA (guanosine(46)-N7)-methyltransferase TrmB [Caulobacterales bacterium]
MSDDLKPLRSFGRMKGRPLKPRQAGLVDTLLPHLAIEIPDGGEIALASPAAAGGLAPPTDEAPSFSRVILEIGFGGGEHLAAQAARDPDALFLGAEPFLNGVGSCLRHIEESGVRNVRLYHGDARDVIEKLPAASLDLVYILFPDPWPKTRHWKRRLIQPDFVAALARVLKPGGEVRFATDWKNYAAWTLEAFVRDGRFAWLAERADDWRKPWPGHLETRYEVKALGDTRPLFLRFARL